MTKAYGVRRDLIPFTSLERQDFCVGCVGEMSGYQKMFHTHTDMGPFFFYFHILSNFLCKCSGLKVVLGITCAITDRNHIHQCLAFSFSCLYSPYHPLTLLLTLCCPFSMPAIVNPSINHADSQRLLSDDSILQLIHEYERERCELREGGGRRYITRLLINHMLKITLSAFPIRLLMLAKLCMQAENECTLCPPSRILLLFLKIICMTFKIYLAKFLTGKLRLTKVSYRL